MAGEVDDETRERITREMEIVGSPVQRWFTEMDAKMSDPLNVDWGKITLGEPENATTESTGKTID